MSVKVINASVVGTVMFGMFSMASLQYSLVNIQYSIFQSHPEGTPEGSAQVELALKLVTSQSLDDN